MQTLLIVGFGDIARRTVPLLRGHWRLLALVRTPQQHQAARAAGVTPISGDLDLKHSLARLAGLADAIIYTAPPPSQGRLDPRLPRLLSALAKTNSIPQRLVYISTSGVYGDRQGDWLDECAKAQPQTERAQRRLSAEKTLRALVQRWPISVTILRAPGIYAAERLPLERLRNRTPMPEQSCDVFVNHIHADDLARCCVHALQRRGGLRIYNACDDRPLLAADWFSALAQCLGLPPPERLGLQALRAVLSPVQMSFLAESRRLSNQRLKREFQLQLRYPDVEEFLARHSATLALDAKIG
jgi:nucleoside-diphosphate-sugar epimerase